MITIKLPSGELAKVEDGIWSVPENNTLAELLNRPSMQPPDNGYYAPSEDARAAEHVLKVWGGTWVSPTPRWPKKVY